MLADTQLEMMLNAFMIKRKHLSKACNGSGHHTPSKAAPKHKKRRGRNARLKANGGAKDDAETNTGANAGIWIYGIHAALAAIANARRHIKRIVVAAKSKENLELRLSEAADICTAQRPQLEIRDQHELDAMLAKGAVHQGVAVLTEPLTPTSLDDVCLNAEAVSKAVVVILDQASDPRNIGGVVRSAAAFGALAVIVQDRHSPEINSAMVKAASGGMEKVPLVRVTNIVRAMETLKKSGFWSIGLDANASKTIAASNLEGKVTLVLGSEGSGLRRLTHEACDMLASIPSAGKLDSLNLSSATAIALYEFYR